MSGLLGTGPLVLYYRLGVFCRIEILWGRDLTTSHIGATGFCGFGVNF